jgi:hypothetical protein
MTFCSSCDAGRYSSLMGSTECQLCKEGFFAPENGSTSCSICPKASSSLAGGANVLDCSCIDGYYQESVGTSFHCIQCPQAQGLKCKGTWANVTQGYYWKPGKVDTFQCIPLEACQESQDLNGTQCSPLYQGDNCGECIAEKSYRTNNACKQCPSNVSQIFVGLLLIAGFIIVCYRLSKGFESATVEMKIVFLSVQLIASFSSFYAKWPAVLSNLFRVLSFSVSC